MALLVCVGCVGYAGVRALRTETPSSKRSPAQLRVRSAVEPELSAVEYVAADPERGGGRIVFELPDDHELLGLLCARIVPEVDGLPDLVQMVEVTSAQNLRGVDLSSWLERVEPSGWHLFQFCLRVRGDGEPFVWVGWARFDPADIGIQDVSVRPRVGMTTRFVATTADGQPIPGALIALDAAKLRPGVVSALLYTGPDGDRLVRGLDPDREIVARLSGVGPARKIVQESFTPPRDTVVLASGLRGEWTFFEWRCRMPFRGASVQIDACATPGRRRSLVWPVSPWVGPGRGPAAPVYFLRPAASNGPLSARVVFRGHEPQGIDDIRAGGTLLLHPSNR